MVRRESLGVCHGQSTVIARVLRIGITGSNMCLASYHRQMDFPMLRQCFSSGTATNSHTPYKAWSSQNWPKITAYDHVHQIFMIPCVWFRRGILCDRGLILTYSKHYISYLTFQLMCWNIFHFDYLSWWEIYNSFIYIVVCWNKIVKLFFSGRMVLCGTIHKC